MGARAGRAAAAGRTGITGKIRGRGGKSIAVGFAPAGYGKKAKKKKVVKRKKRSKRKAEKMR